MNQKGFVPLIIIIIATLVIGAGVGGFLVLREKLEPSMLLEKKNDSAPPRETTRIYTSAEHGFSLRYPFNIPSFGESFMVEKFDHLYLCKLYDKGHDAYNDYYQFSFTLGSDFTKSGEIEEVSPSCVRVNTSFENYVEEYSKQLGISTARNYKMLKLATADGSAAYGLYWEIPLHGATPDSPQIGWSQVHYIFVEIPEARNSDKRALRFFLAGGTSSCSNNICEGQETPSSCPADCKESWDKIINSIFTSFKFTK